MDFARKQLKKYGWTEGKGLGKSENGISEALKPKLKRSVTGIGHDAAADFTEHWWTKLYDKAAKNVEVENKGGKTKKIKIKDDQFKITNSTYHLSKKTGSNENQEEYADFFIKTAVLTKDGVKVENVRESKSNDEDEKSDVLKMTDEELFAACEGRTAHKGARHNLKALGKLARIERQEQMLLAEAKYNGYSHTKKNNKKIESDSDLEVVEHLSLNEGDCIPIKKKKKKRKRCLSNELALNLQPLPENPMETNQCVVIKNTKCRKSKINDLAVSLVQSLPEENEVEMLGSSGERIKKKRKKSERKLEAESEGSIESKSNCKKVNNETETMDSAENVIVENCEDLTRKGKKKKKRKNREV